MKQLYSKILFIISALVFQYSSGFAQLCDTNVPVFNVDFTGSPSTTYTVTNVVRDGLCCTHSNPNRCIEFIITMDPNQQGISLNSSGGPALGAGGIQLECDTNTYSFLDTICLSGVGPHHVTLCKPGGNAYDYYITGIPKPSAGPPIAVSDGCTGFIYASDYIESTLSWTSIAPGPVGTYNMYLDCTNGCDTTVVTSQPGYPDSVLYQVTGTPRGGCSVITVSNSVWVYFVNDKVATILPNNPVVCAGATGAVLTANGTGGRPPYNYLWSTGATTQSITVGVGTYWVRIGDITTCPPVYDTVVVNAKPKPNTDFTSTNACANSGMSFTDITTVSAGTITAWNWNFGDGNTSTIQNPVHVYAAPGNYNVTFISYTESGCTDTVVKTVTVRPTPVASFTANSACYIDSVGFNNTSTISSGTITSWLWNFGDASTSSLQNPDHYYSTGGMFNVLLVATSNFGCKDSAIVPINVQPKPVADFTFTPACVNVSLPFTDASTIISGSITNWSWNFGDGNTSTAQNPGHAYAASGAYNVTLLITAASGCKDTVVKSVNVNVSPAASFTANAMCFIDSVRFDNTSTISSGTIASWNWNFGDAGTSTTQEPSHFYATAGIFNVSLIATSALGCKDTAIVAVNVQQKPVADFTFSSGCVALPVSFTDASSITSGILSSWSWNFGDGNTSAAQNPSHAFATSGTYNVTLITTAVSGCKDTVVKSITINPTPAISFTSNALCYTGSVQFNNTSTISSGSISTWSWNFGDASTSTLQDPSHAYTTSGTFNVTLIGTSALGCRDTTIVPVNVQPKPVADFNFPAACQNITVPFTNASTISSGSITTYNWNFGDGNTSTAQNPTNTFATAGTFNATLIITAASGCIDTVVKSVTVNATPAVSFTSNALCYVGSVQFSNTSTIGSGTISSWSWNFGDASTSTSQDPSHAYAISGTFNVTLIGTSALGCNDTLTMPVNVQPAPVADFNFPAACQNITVPFTNTSTISSGSITTYNWNFGDGNTSTAQNPTNTFATAGTFNVTLIITAASGCIDTVVKSVTVNATPAVSFTSNALCYVGSVQFNNTSTIGSGTISSWSWNFGDASTSTLQNPSHAYATSGIFNVTLIGTSALGCNDTLTIPVNVQPAPVADFNFPAACQNIPVPFTDASSISSGSITTYNWNFGDGNTSTSQNPLHNYAIDGTFNVTLIITAASGCTDTIVKTVNVNPTPAVSFTSNAMCYVGSVQFNNTSTIGSGTISSWSWNFGDASTSTLQDPSHSYATSGIFNVTLIGTSSSGCNDTLTMPVNVQPSPVADFNFPAACQNIQVPFTDASSISSGSITTYNWNFGDGNTSTAQNPLHNYSTDGTFNVTLIITAASGCTDTIVKTVNVNPTPAVSFTSNAMCYVGSVQFNNTSTIGSGTISSWSWNFGDASTSTLQDPSHSYATSGIFNVTLIGTSSSGCNDTLIMPVNVQPAPVADFNFPAACQNIPVPFTDASSISLGSITTYNWNFGDGNTSTSQNAIHTFATDGTFNVTLIITAASGCTDTVVKTVNVNPTPAVSFTSNALCYVGSVQFNNTSTIGSGTISSWSWNFGDASTSTLQDPSHSYATSGIFNVTLIGTSSSGCNDTLTLPVNVQPAPVADFNFPAACQNIPVPFTDASSISSGSITTYNWNFGDGNTSTSQNPIHTFATDGTFNVTLIITAASGCTDTVVKSIIVNTSPVASFVSSDPCSIDSIQFFNTSTIGNGSISSFNWNFGDGNISTLENPAHLYSAVGNYNVTFIVGSPLGCSDTASATINVSLLVAGFTHNAPACQSVAINFNDTSLFDPGTTITGWNWNFGDGNTSTVQNPSYTYSSGGAFTVQLIVSTASGCVDTATQIVNIQGFPIANAGSDTSKCANNPSININGTVLNAGGGQWIGSGTFNPNPFVLNAIYTPSASALSNGFDTLLLVTTSNALCPADTDQVIINFFPGPVVNAGADITVCKDTAGVPVCASITVATGGMWQTSGTGTFVDDSATCTQYLPSTADTTAGSVTLYVTSTGNGDCFAISDTVNIFFTPTPVMMITSNDSTCAGNPYQLGAFTTTGSGAWFSGGTGTFVPNNTAINGFYNPSAADDAAGNVMLYFSTTNNGGCRTQSDTLNLTLIPSPVGSFTSLPACPSLPVMFTDGTTSAVPVVSWNWNFGDGGSSTAQNPSHIYNVGGPYNVSLITVSTNGCIDTVTQQVNVFQKPVAGFDANGNCLKDGTLFNDTSSVTGSTITSWNWNFGDGSANGTVQDPLHVYPSGGTYNATLIVQSAEGCLDTVSQTLGILPSPTANFAADDVTANIGQTIYFQDQSTNGAITWNWDFGDSQPDSTSTVQNPSHIYYTGGYYDVCLAVADANGCTDTVCKIEVVSLPPVVPSGFSPNGDGENDVLYVYGGPFKELEFRIYNNWGELIFISNKQTEGWDGTRKGVEQPLGVYVYTVHAITENDEEFKLSGDVTLLR